MRGRGTSTLGGRRRPRQPVEGAPELKVVHCPACGRKLVDVPQGARQIMTADRKCQGCGVQWRISVRPVTGLESMMPEETAWQAVSHDWP